MLNILTKLTALAIFCSLTSHSYAYDQQHLSLITEKVVSGVVTILSTLSPQIKQGCNHYKTRSVLQYFDELEDDAAEFPTPHNDLTPDITYGSGFIIKSDKNVVYIVTNYHVIADADEVSIVANNNLQHKASIVGIDPKSDLAVLKLIHKDTQGHLSTLQWGDSNNVRVGHFVLAIGSSFGLRNSISHGIISHIARPIPINTNSPQSNLNVIQHCAPINMGDSGGPLVNMDGKVIGINTTIYSSDRLNAGIAFSIPSNYARTRIQQLIEFGHIRLAWLGIKIQTITGEQLNDASLDQNKTYKIISSVVLGGPGSKARIQPGDIMLKYDGHTITDKIDINQLIDQTPIGNQVQIVLWRSGKQISVKATVEEYTPDFPPIPAYQNLKSNRVVVT